MEDHFTRVAFAGTFATCAIAVMMVGHLARRVLPRSHARSFANRDGTERHAVGGSRDKQPSLRRGDRGPGRDPSGTVDAPRTRARCRKPGRAGGVTALRCEPLAAGAG